MLVVLLVAVLGSAGVCWADANSALGEENAELRKRVEKLERELEELKRMVMQQSKAAGTEQKPATAQAREVAVGKGETAAGPNGESKRPVRSKLDIELYGYVKLDAAYDTSRTDVGNFARWVEPEGSNENDDEFNMTANQTRLGLKIAGPQEGEMRTSGRVEIDFYGDGAENRPDPMMRHAYMDLGWPEDRFSILAGQTWDVISPLSPDTLNYSVCWWAGNIGYRRPQIRLTKAFAVNDKADLKLEGALARTLGVSNDFTDDAGEDAGFPGAQGRVSLTFPWLGYKPTTLGVSGHWAKEELDTSASGDSKHFDSWSLNLDLTQPINEWLSVKGEMFTGENLSAYLGGIGQGVNTVRNKEIGSQGGWIAASLRPLGKWRFNLGISIDDVDNGDLAQMTGDRREYNRSIFGNAVYSIDKNTEVGLELSQWDTEYDGQSDGDNTRAQASLIYKF
jgi:hypothetical protein